MYTILGIQHYTPRRSTKITLNQLLSDFANYPVQLSNAFGCVIFTVLAGLLAWRLLATAVLGGSLPRAVAWMDRGGRAPDRARASSIARSVASCAWLFRRPSRQAFDTDYIAPASMATAQKLRLALVGCGRIAQVHWAGIEESASHLIHVAACAYTRQHWSTHATHPGDDS